ncbi:rhamnogalacturonan lyase [Gramella sp. YB25]|uniref:Rhamnogalacturonan lyase n=2 Tax=Christiangramia crocea TaxID=2904124 RepID=A0A9X1V0D8_9FLAO|nr:rhamnogalacturonan lyase [Gramella crocea]
MEYLDRGVVAVKTDDQNVFVSWRLLADDSKDISFNIYKDSVKLNEEPITECTCFVDTTNGKGGYVVKPISSNNKLAVSEKVEVWENAYLEIPIQKPEAGISPDGKNYEYKANDASVGDLDGDGQYEIVLKWDPSNSKDNSHHGYTGNVFLDAYEFNGEQLWRIDLGKNIRAGAHYTQFIVYDLDGDGLAEVACKTADGTMDGKGKIIGDPNTDHRNDKGRILKGPEFLTIFSGKTGEALETTNYLPSRHPSKENPEPEDLNKIWGDSYGNRIDRFLAGVGYFDGKTPSLIMTRGYYTRSVLVAWDWKNGKLTKRWIFDSNENAYSNYAGQGNHQLSIADVDQDGKDEVIFGSMTVDDDGSGLYNSGLGHGDAMHVSDLVPGRDGLEIWTAQEDRNKYRGKGLWLRDAKTGDTLWGVPANGDVGRGLSANIDPNFPGSEMWGAVGGIFSAEGKEISKRRLPMNFAIWWDGDLQRELLDGNIIYKWDYKESKVEELLRAEGSLSNNWTKATPALSADILGDWREEVIFRAEDSNSLRLYSTNIPTSYHFITLMHNPQYRVSVAWQNVSYNQPPHPSFYIGEDMEEPEDPNIEIIKGL